MSQTSVGNRGWSAEPRQPPAHRRAAAATTPKVAGLLHAGHDIGCNTADEVLDALNDLKDAQGVEVTDLQTGMKNLTREAVVNLANAERE